MLNHVEERVLVLTSTAKDAALAEQTFSKAGLKAVVCTNVAHLCREASSGAGALLVAQEAIAPPDLALFVDYLGGQPAWSDIPIALLAASGEGYEGSRRLLNRLRPIGNITVLERPLQKLTLITAVQVALRSRRRQYQVRELLRKLEESKAELQDKIHDLEKFEQVVVGRELRMIELERENQALKQALQRKESDGREPDPGGGDHPVATHDRSPHHRS
ncbi:hypothetical protein [Candidatus Nitrospira bockiana]